MKLITTPTIMFEDDEIKVFKDFYEIIKDLCHCYPNCEKDCPLHDYCEEHADNPCEALIYIFASLGINITR